MNVELADEASFRIVTLIEAGATSAEVVFEARQYVDAWRTASKCNDAKRDFITAVGIFQTNMQTTGEELQKRIPKVRVIERRGVRVTLSGENTHDTRVSLGGASDKVRGQMVAFLSVAEALANESPESDDDLPG